MKTIFAALLIIDCIERSKHLPRIILDESHPLLSPYEEKTISEWVFILNHDAGNGRALRYDLMVSTWVITVFLNRRHLEQQSDFICHRYVFVTNDVGVSDLMSKVKASVDESFNILCNSNPLYRQAVNNNRSKLILYRYDAVQCFAHPQLNHL